MEQAGQSVPRLVTHTLLLQKSVISLFRIGLKPFQSDMLPGFPHSNVMIVGFCVMADRPPEPFSRGSTTSYGEQLTGSLLIGSYSYRSDRHRSTSVLSRFAEPGKSPAAQRSGSMSSPFHHSSLLQAYRVPGHRSIK